MMLHEQEKFSQFAMAFGDILLAVVATFFILIFFKKYFQEIFTNVGNSNFNIKNDLDHF